MAGLKDVALATGVSVRTVSRALKENGYVSEEVRQRVLAAARELDYRPNRLARSLKTNRSYEIMALAWSFDELHAQKIHGLEETLRGQGYWLSLLAASDRNSPDDNNALCGEIFDRAPAAVVAVGASAHWQFSLLARLRERSIPALILDTQFADAEKTSAPAPGIYVDRQSGVYDAVKYLYASGRRRILYAGLSGTLPGIDQTRLLGYQRAIQELNLVPDARYFEAGVERYCMDGEIATGQFYAGRSAAGEILQLPASQRPEAVQAFTDVMALGMLDEFHRRGVRIPDDIAIIGFDNRNAAMYSSPPLTTVAQPSRGVGAAAAEVLLAMVGQSSASASSGSKGEGAGAVAPTIASRVLPTSLVRRASA